jgi:hypothetical protein
MTVETRIDTSDQSKAKWSPEARRQGERRDCPKPPQVPETDDERIFPSITAPPVWPRIFPGL